jgi:hypothetical protein
VKGGYSNKASAYTLYRKAKKKLLEVNGGAEPTEADDSTPKTPVKTTPKKRKTVPSTSEAKGTELAVDTSANANAGDGEATLITPVDAVAQSGRGKKASASKPKDSVDQTPANHSTGDQPSAPKRPRKPRVSKKAALKTEGDEAERTVE